MTVNSKGKPIPLVSPEEAIQWLLDTGMIRAKRWEDALDEWDRMTPAQRTAAVSVSLAERNSLRDTAGIARRTGYYPKEQIQRLSTLVYSAVTKGLEASGLEAPENRASINIFWDVVLSTLQEAERELAGPGPSQNDFDEVIDGRVSGEGTRIGEYDEWSTAELRAELSERGLSRSGSRRILIKKLLEDDARPEDGSKDASKNARGMRLGMKSAMRREAREQDEQDDDESEATSDFTVSPGDLDDIIVIESEPDEPDEPDNG